MIDIIDTVVIVDIVVNQRVMFGLFLIESPVRDDLRRLAMIGRGWRLAAAGRYYWILWVSARISPMAFL